MKDSPTYAPKQTPAKTQLSCLSVPCGALMPPSLGMVGVTGLVKNSPQDQTKPLIT